MLWAAPAAKGRGQKPKPASAPIASFHFIHRTPSWLGGAILAGRREGTAVPIPPDATSPGLHPPEWRVCDLAIKTPVRLAPF